MHIEGVTAKEKPLLGVRGFSKVWGNLGTDSTADVPPVRSSNKRQPCGSALSNSRSVSAKLGPVRQDKQVE
ncbi:hypothetical protein GCM10007170_46450 [Arthrobacter liuii]|uniref:Uncharacterized protein n=1 Tax=Arthrobacter liuii TaxID=1476996 RepID=A0ABQ2AZ91_9MICC|nr:hypothetical protein GCM10007170_46450 [Arthrobacter liuii]